MEIAEAIAPQLRGDYLERIAADLRHRCDRDGSVGDGDVHRAALAARAANHSRPINRDGAAYSTSAFPHSDHPADMPDRSELGQ